MDETELCHNSVQREGEGEEGDVVEEVVHLGGMWGKDKANSERDSRTNTSYIITVPAS